MSSHTYRLEAGRCIMRDDKPFVIIHRAQSATGTEYVNPSDVDNFAHVCTAAPELLEALKAMLDAFGNCGSPHQQRAADMAMVAIEKVEHPYG